VYSRSVRVISSPARKTRRAAARPRRLTLGAIGATALLALASSTVLGADPVKAPPIKVGFVSTFSGPNAPLGTDIRDGYELAMKHLGGKLGGIPAETIFRDDQFSVDTGKQLFERLIRQDRVDFLTGLVFSNIMLAVAPAVFESETPYVSANAGPTLLAGRECSPWFASVAWPNDAMHEAVGRHASNKGYKLVALIAPNYPAGRDALAGFKRFYTGQVGEELYPRLGQLDFAAEIAQLRAAHPDAVYAFMPGAMGINFIKQFVAAGLPKDAQLLLPGSTADEDIIRAVGEPMLGLFDTAAWNHDFDNPANRRFVADFEQAHGRLPSLYAAQGYDAALMLDALVRKVGGRLTDKAAMKSALRTARFASVRGDFRFNVNGYPIQNYYLRVIVRDPKGRITNRTIGTVLTDHGDSYAPECKLK